MPGEISVIPSFKIDVGKWDRCIDDSVNGLIYSKALYLNHLADNWTGIVMNDYEAVMAVAWKKKLGVVYCYDVPFIQQLGVVYQARQQDLQPFIDALNRLCRYGRYPFNFDNKIDGAICTNFVHDITVPYDRLWRSFSEDARQHTKAEARTELQYAAGDYEEVLELCRELYGKNSGLAGSHFNKMKQLCYGLRQEGKLEVRKAVDASGSTMAVALMPKDKRRLYNIVNGTVSEGKKSKANYFLLSRIWMEFCGSGLLFDFEGSDIKGVRDFYKKFSPRYEPYNAVQINRLPALIKMLKK
jgi:hypothetical protein